MWKSLVESPDWRYLAGALAVMTLLQIIGPEALRYQRDWHDSGELWRFFSAHWVHVGWAHLALNSAGLIICVALTAPRWPAWRWLLVTAVIGICISVLVEWRNPEIRDYAGHSGVLFGLYLLGALALFARDRLVAVLIIVAIAVKIGLEQYAGVDFDTGRLIGANVIVDAHLYGVIGAIVVALVTAGVTMNQRGMQSSDNHE